MNPLKENPGLLPKQPGVIKPEAETNRTPTEAQVSTVALGEIEVDPRLQQRAKVDQSTIKEYAAAMRDGVVFPSLVVFKDPQENKTWLVDGFHRLAAAKQAGLDEIPCEVRPGSFRDAQLHSFRVNTIHGLKRSTADKRQAVRNFLVDPEWSKWSNREIARHCTVSDKTVASVRAEMTNCGNPQLCAKGEHEERRRGADGKMRRMPTKPTSPNRGQGNIEAIGALEKANKAFEPIEDVIEQALTTLPDAAKHRFACAIKSLGAKIDPEYDSAWAELQKEISSQKTKKYPAQ